MIIVSDQGTTTEVLTPTSQQIQASYLVTLIGADGTEWNLNDGPVQLRPGVKLFGTPPITNWTRSAPRVPGSRWTGLHVEEKDVVLPVMLLGDDWADYRASDQAFFRALEPGGEITLVVTSPDAVSRTLTCYFVSDGDAEDDIDPLVFARKAYSLAFIAPTPFWAGPVVSTSVTFSDPIPFPLPNPLPAGVPFGTVLWLNQAGSSARTTINNPGDVPAWTRSTVVGPATSFSVGVGSSLVTATGLPIAGDVIEIDSAPGKKSIVDGDGVRQYAAMDTVQFAPVPRGEDVPIVATMRGIGDESRIDVELTPLYWRPL